ncbi:MAG: hypothetical protein M3071_05085 [Actinomycetota bacterium]|nr:hypothetical protein [Actinomycetota bacterium]
MSPGSVHFEIRRITLNGYSPAQRTRFVDSLQAQLTELGKGDGWPRAGRRTVRALDAGTLKPGASPEAAAAQVAATLRSALTGGTRR